MRLINHAMTGAIIGLAVSEPAVAIPLALASHFVCDIIPHHGTQTPNIRLLRSKLFRNTLVLDASLCIALVLILAIKQPRHWLLAAICAFIATAPDLFFANRYIKAVQHKAWQPSRLVKWMIDIQWFQRPIGAAVEIVWFAAAVIILLPFFK